MDAEASKSHTLLDNQTSDHLIVNEAFAGPVKKTTQGIDMHTNVGKQGINSKAPLHNVGDVWFHDKMMANALSQAKLMDDPDFNVAHVKKTPSRGDCFTLTHILSKNCIKFTQIGDHCAYKPNSSGKCVSSNCRR